MASRVSRYALRIVGLAVTAFALAQCALFASIFGPSKWDVLSALAAFEDGVEAADSGTSVATSTSVTWANSDGSAAFEYSIPTGSPPSFPGQYTFKGYRSSRSAYVLDGTLAIALNNPYYGSVGGIYKVADLAITGTLSLSGGDLSSLDFNISSSLYGSTSGGSTHFSASNYGGTLSANGNSFDVARLYE